MHWIIVFLVIWAVLAVLVVLGAAMVPTTVRISNRALILPIAICALVAALLTLVAAGADSLFS